MSKEISRRSFLAGTALAGATMATAPAAMALSSGSASSGSSSAASSGAAGNGSSASSSDSSSAGASGGSASSSSANAVVETTSWGVFDGEGMFTPSFLIAPDPIPEDQIKESFDVDIVVIGMGLSGMSAARSAFEEGCSSIMVIEKGETHHVHSHQFQAINCQAAKDMGAEVSQETIDLLVDAEISGFRERIDKRLWKYLLNHCGEDFDWYLSLTDKYTVIDPNELVKDTALDAKAIMNICTSGLGWVVGRAFDDVSDERNQAAIDGGPYISIFNHPLNPNWDITTERYPMSPGVVTVEPNHAVLGQNLATFVETNCDVRYACWAKRILRDETSGRVTGIIYADADDNYFQVNASKGVILCTGDFAGNKAMVNYYQDCHRLIQGGDLGWPDVDAKGNRTNMGEGLSMAHWIGAKVDTTHACCNDHYGGALGCDPMLFVDGSGQRFMNEDVVGEILGEKVNRVAGQTIWQVFDDNYPDQITNMPVGHRTYWKVVDSYDDIPMGLFLDPVGMITRTEVEAWPGLIGHADTVEELAAQMEVDPDVLQATFDRYNELVEKGVDEDFGKRADRMAPVKQPPFYASKMGPLGYQTFYGSVCCDNEVRAIDENNDVIPGLYVAGTVMGSRFWNVYQNTAMGVNHAGALCYGRLAGKNAAQGI